MIQNPLTESTPLPLPQNDCQYFAELYDEKIKVTDAAESLKEIYATLKEKGCTKKDSVMIMLKEKFEQLKIPQPIICYSPHPATEAKKFFQKGKYQKAIEEYEKAKVNALKAAQLKKNWGRPHC